MTERHEGMREQVKRYCMPGIQYGSMTVVSAKDYDALADKLREAETARDQQGRYAVEMFDECNKRQKQINELEQERDEARSAAGQTAPAHYWATKSKELEQAIESKNDVIRTSGLKIVELEQSTADLTAKLAAAERNEHAAMLKIEQLEADNAALREAYNELIMAVARKFPNETRHQTALRYIRQAEKSSGDQQARKALGREALGREAH